MHRMGCYTLYIIPFDAQIFLAVLTGDSLSIFSAGCSHMCEGATEEVALLMPSNTGADLLLRAL